MILKDVSLSRSSKLSRPEIPCVICPALLHQAFKAGKKKGEKMAVDPSTLRRGLYRIMNPPGMEHDVQVEDVNGGQSTPLTESRYRARGYKPSFERLPTREEYFAAKEAAQKKGDKESK